MAKYLGVDCEFGGFMPEASLLTVGLSVRNSDFVEIDSLHLNVYPENGIYIVTPEALEITGIDLLEHSRIAKPADKCSEEIRKFIKRHACVGFDEEYKREIVHKLTAVGHSVKDDIEKIKAHFPDCKWLRYVGFRYVDTLVIGWFLQSIGVIPPMKMGLAAALSVASPSYKFKPHNALEDARASLELLKSWRSVIDLTVSKDIWDLYERILECEEESNWKSG